MSVVSCLSMAGFLRLDAIGEDAGDEGEPAQWAVAIDHDLEGTETIVDPSFLDPDDGVLGVSIITKNDVPTRLCWQLTGLYTNDKVIHSSTPSCDIAPGLGEDLEAGVCDSNV